jgi:hypothetical protein
MYKYDLLESCMECGERTVPEALTVVYEDVDMYGDGYLISMPVNRIHTDKDYCQATQLWERVCETCSKEGSEFEKNKLKEELIDILKSAVNTQVYGYLRLKDAFAS